MADPTVPATNANTAGQAATTPEQMVGPTKNAMDTSIQTNMLITQLTIAFQTAMQGINSVREAATEAYKKAGEANNSMHQ